MKSTVAAAFLFALGAYAQSITLNTPSGSTPAIQCQIYQVTWTGGTAPFSLRLNDGAQNFIKEIASNVQSSPFAWTVDQAQGTSVGLVINDAQGNNGATAPFTIEPSSDTSCLNGGSASSASGASSASDASTSAAASAASSASTAAASTASSVAASVSSAVASTSRAATSTRASASGSASGAASSASTTANADVSLRVSGALGAIVAGAIALIA
ncbi:hypothetical protein OF83DRAFT_1167477 [Amylostereum chailletii]|nr:hypothetical protein OF83DRAFT_1167477 [Amylostereum chailletii]